MANNPVKAYPKAGEELPVDGSSVSSKFSGLRSRWLTKYKVGNDNGKRAGIFSTVRMAEEKPRRNARGEEWGIRKLPNPVNRKKASFARLGEGGPGESKEANKYYRDQAEPRRDMPDRSQQISTETERRRLASCPASGVAGNGNAIRTQHAPPNLSREIFKSVCCGGSQSRHAASD